MGLKQVEPRLVEEDEDTLTLDLSTETLNHVGMTSTGRK